jgi:hypothetical protein
MEKSAKKQSNPDFTSPDVFISHSHKDDNVADRVKEAIESRGISCWVDHQNGEKGIRFEEQIVETIENAKVFIIIFSSHVANSDYIPNELAIAFEEKVRIMPFRLDNTAYPSFFKFYLRSVNWLEAYPEPVDKYIDELADKVCIFLQETGGKKDQAPEETHFGTRQSLSSLFIITPDENSPKYGSRLKEQGMLHDLLKKEGVICDYFKGKDATLNNILRRLQQQKYDIIHIFSPIGFDGKDYRFLLNGRTSLPARVIRENVKGSPIVVLNSDWGGSFQVRNPNEALKGIVDAFLDAGSKFVIGSLFDVPDAGIYAFNEKFYERILDGNTCGEAMGKAREHVMGKEQYGAAWACFVMYGDSSLRINEKDSLQELLNDTGLKVDDFEVSGQLILEQAIEFGRSMGNIDTSHLFTAMLGGKDGTLRDRLKEQGVSPEILREEFLEFFKSFNFLARSHLLLTLSPNMKGILSDALDLAKSQGQNRITEKDILVSFVKRQGGGTGMFLREEYGIDLEKLSMSPKNQQTTDPTDVCTDRIGILLCEDFTADAWKVLTYSAYASQSKNGLVGSPQLFAGMLQLKDGALRRAFLRMGINLSQEDIKYSPVNWIYGGKCYGKVKDIKFTENVLKILKQAGKNAAVNYRNKISDDDILSAFVLCGGGETGKLLRSYGLVLEVLTSTIFLDNGDLNTLRFDDEARHALEMAFECARNVGSKKLKMEHLIYAMLLTENSTLNTIICFQGKDPGKIKELLARSGLISREGAPTKIAANASNIDGSLIRLLCMAESQTKNRFEPQTGVKQIIKGIFAEKNSKITRLLLDQGIKIEG